MTPEETQILASLGKKVNDNTILLSIYVFTWGIHTLASFAALYALVLRGLRRPASKFLCVTLVMLVIAYSLHVVGYFKAYCIDLVRGAFLEGQDVPLQERLSNSSVRRISSFSARATAILGTQPGALILIGDVVIFWRAWMIWMGRRIWMVVPAFLIMASTATTLYFFTLAFGTIKVVNNDDLSAIIQITAGSCSIAANASATAMIGLQAYHHQKIIKNIIKRRSSPSTRILLFLTEGGLAYLVLQIVTFALNLCVTPTAPPAYLIWYLRILRITVFVATTLPAIVVLMAAYNRSLANDSGISGDMSAIDTQIAFGHSFRTRPRTDTIPSELREGDLESELQSTVMSKEKHSIVGSNKITGTTPEVP